MAEINKKKIDDNKNDWENDDDWGDWSYEEDKSAAPKTEAVNNNNQEELVDKKERTKANSNNYSKGEEKSLIANNSGMGWGSLFGGVMSSVFTTASEGLGNITTTMTQKLDKVIGLPDPVEMARLNAIEEAKAKKLAEDVTQKEQTLTQAGSNNQLFGLNLVTGVTNLGTKVINTGLDTLEGIGKKTMTLLQENDPSLKDKIKKLALETEKPNLSEVLKQAKHENEKIEQTLKDSENKRDEVTFKILFENNCGLVHLEALEILSKESELKIRTLLQTAKHDDLTELNETLEEVKELLELEEIGEDENIFEPYDAEELQKIFKEAIDDIKLGITFEDIVTLWADTLKWLKSDEPPLTKTKHIYARGVTILSETCALQMAKLHKIAELLLIKEQHSTVNEVDAISQLSRHFIVHLHVLANQFVDLFVNSKAEVEDCDEDSHSYVSSTFSEMLQARQQIEKAHILFLPILQIGAV
uniref:Protein FAM114A2 n=1 Tax=Glossina brevipalpis TaxID=37001 RepID=A0A1A9W9D1_9MUSC